MVLAGKQEIYLREIYYVNFKNGWLEPSEFKRHDDRKTDRQTATKF